MKLDETREEALKIQGVPRNMKKKVVFDSLGQPVVRRPFFLKQKSKILLVQEYPKCGLLFCAVNLILEISGKI